LRRIKERIEKGEHREFHINKGITHGNRLCVPQIKELNEEIMKKTYSTPYIAHPGVPKCIRTCDTTFYGT